MKAHWYSIAAAVVLATTAHAHDGDFNQARAVFVMTNDADSNEVIAYERNQYGTLFASHHFRTGGRGSGGHGDPLSSQGSLTLSDDQQWLFAVNAGSGSLSVFRVEGAFLLLTDQMAVWLSSVPAYPPWELRTAGMPSRRTAGSSTSRMRGARQSRGLRSPHRAR
jgi:hypothetical protein